LGRKTLTAKTKFQLTKWYADCVAENGDAIIVYCGIARWRAFTLCYASVLEAKTGKEPHARYSLKKCAMPLEEATTIRWQCKSLQIEGIWERLDPSCDAQIYESSEGSIEWRCVLPRARATLTLDHGVILQGLGYVDRLEMSVAPWNLPIDELRWGRFLSESDSLVWIDWQGEHPRRIVLENGTPRNATSVGESEIILDGDVSLQLSGGDVLRTGALGKTALGAIPGVMHLLPKRLLDVQECKWRSRAELLRGNAASSGWAIHEVVRWPK
jgi:hypothetical protein